MNFSALFGSERQNVIKACDIIRHSPLIGPKIPVHGLLVDTETGKLDWIVNGYQTLETAASHPVAPANFIGQTTDRLGHFNIGEMKFPEAKIGEMAAHAEDWLKQKAAQTQAKAAEEVAKSAEEVSENCHANRRVCRKALAANARPNATTVVAAQNSDPAADSPAHQPAADWPLTGFRVFLVLSHFW